MWEVKEIQPDVYVVMTTTLENYQRVYTENRITITFTYAAEAQEKADELNKGNK